MLSLVSGLSLVATCGVLYIAWPPRETEAGYYVVDTQKIIEAEFSALVSRHPSPEQARVQSESFAKDLNAALRGLGERGHLVINKNATIAFAPERDLTALLAKSLDLELGDKADPSEDSAKWLAPPPDSPSHSSLLRH